MTDEKEQLKQEKENIDQKLIDEDAPIKKEKEDTTNKLTDVNEKKDSSLDIKESDNIKSVQKNGSKRRKIFAAINKDVSFEDKKVIIIDNGSYSIKAGFCGDGSYELKDIIPTIVGYNKYKPPTFESIYRDEA